MRITAFLLLFSVIQAIGENSYSQNTRLSLNLKDVSIENVLDEIENQSEFYFLFNHKLVNVDRKVDINAKNKSIKDILANLFAGENVNCMVLDRQILLSPEYMTETVNVTRDRQPQEIVVTGKLTDEDGNPLPGVNILIKGTITGVITNMDGNYSIEVDDPDAILVFSFIGMTTQEVDINGRSIINVTLEKSAIGLDEIIVVGYGTQTKKTLTGAVTAIKSESLLETKAVSVSSAMVGKIAGITSRITDGRPGGATTLEIRNYGTPLFIIDGIPRTQADFNTLDMNNIESISVLKDASASIYGMRAANGVVLVTTKLGKIGEKPTINVNSYYGLQYFTRFPRPPDAYHYMLGLAESNQNRGIPQTVTQEELNNWKAQTYDPANGIDYRSFDYYDEIVGKNFPSPQYSFNINALGASERSSYFFSFGRIKQNPPMSDSYWYERNNLRVNLEAKLLKGLKIGTQMTGRFEQRSSAGLPGWDDYNNIFRGILRNWPTERPYANDNPKYINNTHSININPGTYDEEITGPADIYDRVFRANMYAEYDFEFGLKAKATVGYGFSYHHSEFFEYTYVAYTYDRLADEYNIVPGGGNQNPFRAFQREQEEDKFGQFQLTYNKKFGKHSISTLGAFEWNEGAHAYAYVHTVPPNNHVFVLYTADVNDISTSYDYSARASYIGKVNYNFAEKYLVELLGRYDGSYLYAPGKRWGLFPGISVGWRMSNEPFFSPLTNIFSEFKIRGSWGESGSEVGVSPFAYQEGFNWAAGEQIFNNTYYSGVGARGLPVANLSWITNTFYNLGIDFSLLNGKWNGQFDIFERRVTGIPAARYDVLLPSEVGYSLPNENLNSTADKGIEGAVDYSGQIGEVSFKVGANATLSRQMNIETYKPRFGNSYDEYRTSTEKRWDAINWGYHILGQFQNQEEIENYPVDIDGTGNRTLLPGDLIYEDYNGDKIINSMDQQPIGYGVGNSWFDGRTGTRYTYNSATPLINFGLNAMFNYRGFNLMINFAGGSMQSFLRRGELKIPFNANGASPDFLIEDRWHREDPFDNTSPWISGANPPTRKDYDSHSNFNKTNDFYLINVKYIRLRDLEFGYTVPERLTGKLGINKLRVYTNISNLFSIDNMRDFDIDPEISGQGAGLVYPQSRVFNFGFYLTL